MRDVAEGPRSSAVERTGSHTGPTPVGKQARTHKPRPPTAERARARPLVGQCDAAKRGREGRRINDQLIIPSSPEKPPWEGQP